MEPIKNKIITIQKNKQISIELKINNKTRMLKPIQIYLIMIIITNNNKYNKMVVKENILKEKNLLKQQV